MGLAWNDYQTIVLNDCNDLTSNSKQATLVSHDQSTTIEHAYTPAQVLSIGLAA